MKGLRLPRNGSAAYQEFHGQCGEFLHGTICLTRPNCRGPRLRGCARTAGWGGIDKICRSSVSHFQDPFGTTALPTKGAGDLSWVCRIMVYRLFSLRSSGATWS